MLDYLLSLKDNKTKVFNEKIISTKYEMLGIKVPILKNIALKLTDNEIFNLFNMPNNYYEVVLLKGLAINRLKDFTTFNTYFDIYLKLIDNWALCDIFCSNLKIVKNNKECFLNKINDLINTQEEYLVRVGLVLLLIYYISEEYINVIFEIINKTKSNYYYVNMARAWLLCECFIKYENETLNYLECNSLDSFTINKTISKIKDSRRVNKSTKAYIMQFKKES